MTDLRYGFSPWLLALLACGAACSGAETVPADQRVPATQSVSAAVSTPANEPPGPPRFLQHFDQNHDGKLQVSELPQQMRHWLGTADTDKDGVLSREELAAHHAKMDTERWAKLDANGDGKVELSELPQPLKERLAKADTNNDGVLSREEMDAQQKSMRMGGFSHMGGPPKLDTNGDGKVEVSELPPGLKEQLNPADTDHDGILTREELDAFHKARQAERFREADANSDGALTEAEVGPQRWPMLRNADLDGDGKLTQAEIEQAFASGKLGHFGPGFGRPGFRGPPAPQK